MHFPLMAELCRVCGQCRTVGGKDRLQLVLLRYLRPRREKIFGPAPSHRLDGNAKARLWAAAAAYNMANRQPRQHQGPLTWATLRVLRALLWRFHGADGGGRCFPSYERIASAAKCHRDSVCVAIAALEDAGILTWVHRLTKIRRREQDLFGHWGSVWQVIRTSNGYRFADPLDRDPGRCVSRKIRLNPRTERNRKNERRWSRRESLKRRPRRHRPCRRNRPQLLSDASTPLGIGYAFPAPSGRRLWRGWTRG
jgi:hypothetical protein